MSPRITMFRNRVHTRNSFTIAGKSTLMKHHYALKKLAKNPSGHGLFPYTSAGTALVSSSSMINASNILWARGENLHEICFSNSK
jgi:hypothetical protein